MPKLMMSIETVAEVKAVAKNAYEAAQVAKRLGETIAEEIFVYLVKVPKGEIDDIQLMRGLDYRRIKMVYSAGQLRFF